MPYLLSNYSYDKTLYISKNRIVTASIGAQTYKAKDWANGWMNISKLLPNKADQRKCFFSQWKIGFFNEIKSCLTIFVNVLQKKYYFKTFCEAFFLISFIQKLFFSVIKQLITLLK